MGLLMDKGNLQKVRQGVVDPRCSGGSTIARPEQISTLGRQHQIMGSSPAQRIQSVSRRQLLEPPMYSDAYPIGKKRLPKKSEWAESYGTGFQVR